jgi:ribonuclease Z
MRPRFHPRLANDPFGDPCLFIPFGFENRAFMVDLGEAPGLAPRDLLRTTHAFVSHTHMDHFAGFDRLLRISLGRAKQLHLFGPRGFIGNVRGKLAGYAWNLVDRFPHSLELVVHEVRPRQVLTTRLDCRKGFRPTAPPERRAFDGRLLEEPSLTVEAAILDHGIPCLGFAIRERFHINILRTALEEMGLPTGHWLQGFKQALFQSAPPETPIAVPQGRDPAPTRRMPLGALAARIARISPGQKIAYLADTVCSRENVGRMVALASGADHLFIEAAFLGVEADLARAKRHLTAAQAGWIARRAEAKRLTVFHFSPRYSDGADVLRREARQAFLAPPGSPPPAGCPIF